MMCSSLSRRPPLARANRTASAACRARITVISDMPSGAVTVSVTSRSAVVLAGRVPDEILALLDLAGEVHHASFRAPRP
jgi:hypothetical protein